MYIVDCQWDLQQNNTLANHLIIIAWSPFKNYIWHCGEEFSIHTLSSDSSPQCESCPIEKCDEKHTVVPRETSRGAGRSVIIN